MKNLFVLVALFLVPIAAFSQQTSGRTDVYYDSGNNVVFATASLNPDYQTQYYYGISMTTYLDGEEGWVANPVSYNGPGPGSTYIEAPAQAGHQYMADTFSWVVTSYQTYEVVSGCSDCYDWYDSYGYDSFYGRGDPESSGISYTIFVWAAPIVVERLIQQYVSLGQSEGRQRAPGERMDFQVLFKAFIPWLYVWAGGYCSDPIAGSSEVIYDGNNRTYNSMVDVSKAKATNLAYLLPDQGGGNPSTSWHQIGYTKRYSKETGLGAGILVDDSVLHDCYRLDDQGAGGDSMHIDFSGNAGSRAANVHFYGDARNEITGLGSWAPAISWDISVTVSKSNPSAPDYSVVGWHDCMPAFEIYIAGQTVYQQPPYPSGPEAWFTVGYCLSGSGSTYVNTTGTVFQ